MNGEVNPTRFIVATLYCASAYPAFFSLVPLLVPLYGPLPPYFFSWVVVGNVVNAYGAA